MEIRLIKKPMYVEVAPCKICGFDMPYLSARICFDCCSTEQHINKMIERNPAKAAEFLRGKAKEAEKKALDMPDKCKCGGELYRHNGHYECQKCQQIIA